MKAVLISIKPKYCELIANGKKTIEVRKTLPELEPPFKCFIYCTKSLPYLYREANPPYDLFFDKNLVRGGDYENRYLSGKVIGEFVCDRIEEFYVFENKTVQKRNYFDLEKSCLSYKQIADYIGKNKNGYAWHISNLKIYDKPKELGEFWKPCSEVQTAQCYLDNCERCPWNVITRPPQSWCYVEEQ